MELPKAFTQYWRKWRNNRILARYATSLDRWQSEEALLRGELATALVPSSFASVAPTGLLLHRNEAVLLVLHGTALVELRQLPAHWVGGYSGASLRIMKGVTYHVGVRGVDMSLGLTRRQSSECLHAFIGAIAVWPLRSGPLMRHGALAGGR